MIYAQASRTSQVLGDRLTTTIRLHATNPARNETQGPDQRPVVLAVEGGVMIEMLLDGRDTTFQLITTDNRESAINQLRRHDPLVVVVDLDRGEAVQPSLDDLTAGAPPVPAETPTEAGQAEAFRTMQDLLALSPTTRIIALTAAGDREAALRATAAGAHDVFEKPLDADAFQIVVERAIRLAEMEGESQRRLDAANESGINGIVTRSPAMLKVCRQVLALALTRETVLLQGEPGTGKQLLAQALHLQSPRADHRFVVVRCTTKDESRLHAELFGREFGLVDADEKNTESNRAASTRQPGKLALADGGTLFLDEVSELPMSVQIALRQFLQDQALAPSCEDVAPRLDVRLVCSTRFDLNELAEQDRFDADLAFMLSATRLRVPPLRERHGDAALLAHEFLRRLGRRHGRNRLTLSEATLDTIGTYPFPGNTRELENAMRQAVANVIGRVIAPAHLELPTADEPEMLNLRRIRDDAERQAVLKVMARANGNVARAAELLGISRPTLYDLLNRFGLR